MCLEDVLSQWMRLRIWYCFTTSVTFYTIWSCRRRSRNLHFPFKSLIEFAPKIATTHTTNRSSSIGIMSVWMVSAFYRFTKHHLLLLYTIAYSRTIWWWHICCTILLLTISILTKVQKYIWLADLRSKSLIHMLDINGKVSPLTDANAKIWFLLNSIESVNRSEKRFTLFADFENLRSYKIIHWWISVGQNRLNLASLVALGVDGNSGVNDTWSECLLVLCWIYWIRKR